MWKRWHRTKSPGQAAESAARHVGSTPTQADELRDSTLFDTQWYLGRYPDVAAAGIDPVEHYLTIGAAQGYDPNPYFETRWYADRYPDAVANGVNPLVHFLRNGATEPLHPGPRFDTAWYITENPEVLAAGLIPLVHFLESGLAEGRTALPAHAGQGFESYERAQRAGLLAPAMREKLRAATGGIHFPLQPPSADAEGGRLPMPPLDLVVRIGSLTLDDFEVSGRDTKRTIARCLPPDFSFKGARCLDFGCGIGRIVRHFAQEAREAEIWGCDIDGTSMRWAVENLSPPFRFFQLGDVPAIPLESSSFDLVYAVAVFSQINTDWHHWATELRRVLKPGGVLITTYAGQTPFEEMLSAPYDKGDGSLGMYVKNPLHSWNRGGPMVFVSADWFKAFWGSLFDIEFIALEGLMDYQTICVARKPLTGAPIKVDPPILALGTAQRFNINAVGKIDPCFDSSRPYRDSYGIEGSGEISVTGWIAFRDDRPERAEAFVDGAEFDFPVSFALGATYRDWSAPVAGFEGRLDPSSLAPGEHRLSIRVYSCGGERHDLSIPLVIGDPAVRARAAPETAGDAA